MLLHFQNYFAYEFQLIYHYIITLNYNEKIDNLKALLKRPVREVQAILPNLPAGVVDSMKSVAADMVRTGELDSISTIRALDGAWGTDLAILTGLNSDTE